MPIQRDGPLEFRIADVVRLRKPHPADRSIGKSTGLAQISASNAPGASEE